MLRRLLSLLFAICSLFRILLRPHGRGVIELTNNLDVYAGNNSTVTGYPITFRFDANSWLNVERVNADGGSAILELGVDYTLTGSGKDVAAVLKTTAAVPVTSKLAISRYSPAVSLFNPET